MILERQYDLGKAKVFRFLLRLGTRFWFVDSRLVWDWPAVAWLTGSETGVVWRIGCWYRWLLVVWFVYYVYVRSFPMSSESHKSQERYTNC